MIAINGWNRLAVGFRSPVGDYVSRRAPADGGSAPDRTPAPDVSTLDVRSYGWDYLESGPELWKVRIGRR